MNKDFDVFGYLLITRESMKNCNEIAQDYQNTTEKFKKMNSMNKTKYSCRIISFKLSWLQRIKLSRRTGIPLIKITNVRRICKFGIIISENSMNDKSFFGRIKVYDSQKNIPPTLLNRQVEIFYN